MGDHTIDPASDPLAICWTTDDGVQECELNGEIYQIGDDETYVEPQKPGPQHSSEYSGPFSYNVSGYCLEPDSTQSASLPEPVNNVPYDTHHPDEVIIDDEFKAEWETLSSGYAQAYVEGDEDRQYGYFAEMTKRAVAITGFEERSAELGRARQDRARIEATIRELSSGNMCDLPVQGTSEVPQVSPPGCNLPDVVYSSCDHIDLDMEANTDFTDYGDRQSEYGECVAGLTADIEYLEDVHEEAARRVEKMLGAAIMRSLGVDGGGHIGEDNLYFDERQYEILGETYERAGQREEAYFYYNLAADSTTDVAKASSLRLRAISMLDRTELESFVPEVEGIRRDVPVMLDGKIPARFAMGDPERLLRLHAGDRNLVHETNVLSIDILLDAELSHDDPSQQRVDQLHGYLQRHLELRYDSDFDMISPLEAYHAGRALLSIAKHEVKKDGPIRKTWQKKTETSFAEADERRRALQMDLLMVRPILRSKMTRTRGNPFDEFGAELEFVVDFGGRLALDQYDRALNHELPEILGEYGYTKRAADRMRSFSEGLPYHFNERGCIYFGDDYSFSAAGFYAAELERTAHFLSTDNWENARAPVAGAVVGGGLGCVGGALVGSLFAGWGAIPGCKLGMTLGMGGGALAGAEYNIYDNLELGEAQIQEAMRAGFTNVTPLEAEEYYADAITYQLTSAFAGMAVAPLVFGVGASLYTIGVEAYAGLESGSVLGAVWAGARALARPAVLVNGPLSSGPWWRAAHTVLNYGLVPLSLGIMGYDWLGFDDEEGVNSWDEALAAMVLTGWGLTRFVAWDPVGMGVVAPLSILGVDVGLQGMHYRSSLLEYLYLDDTDGGRTYGCYLGFLVSGAAIYTFILDGGFTFRIGSRIAGRFAATPTAFSLFGRSLPISANRVGAAGLRLGWGAWQGLMGNPANTMALAGGRLVLNGTGMLKALALNALINAPKPLWEVFFRDIDAENFAAWNSVNYAGVEPLKIGLMKFVGAEPTDTGPQMFGNAFGSSMAFFLNSRWPLFQGQPDLYDDYLRLRLEDPELYGYENVLTSLQKITSYTRINGGWTSGFGLWGSPDEPELDECPKGLTGFYRFMADPRTTDEQWDGFMRVYDYYWEKAHDRDRLTIDDKRTLLGLAPVAGYALLRTGKFGGCSGGGLGSFDDDDGINECYYSALTTGYPLFGDLYLNFGQTERFTDDINDGRYDSSFGNGNGHQHEGDDGRLPND